MPFGQVVVGPPGSGKTTYCHGMAQYLAAVGRKVALINMDPANDVLPYQPAVDVSDLVCLEEVMAELKLGPNGGMVYCMDYLQQNLDWLKEQLAPFEQEGCYFIFDCPGQVELHTLHGSFKQIVDTLTGPWNYRLTAVSLVDAHLCTEPSKYISALLLSLSTMLHLELPHVNVLSKMDLIRQYGRLAFNLDFYTEVHNLSYLVRAMGDDPFAKRFRKLSAALCEVVQDFGLVSFVPLAIQDQQSLKRVLGLVDKANGCVYAGLGPQTPVPPEFVYGSAHRAADDDIWSSYQEMYVEGRGPAAQRGQLPAVVEHEVHVEDVIGQQVSSSASQQGPHAQQVSVVKPSTNGDDESTAQTGGDGRAGGQGADSTSINADRDAQRPGCVEYSADMEAASAQQEASSSVGVASGGTGTGVRRQQQQQQAEQQQQQQQQQQLTVQQEPGHERAKGQLEDVAVVAHTAHAGIATAGTVAQGS